MAGREDLYIILEVNRRASENEIKRAFRKLARRFHPDINPGDGHAEDRFKRITEAYDILSDPLKREFYDVNGFYSNGVLESDGKGTGWGDRKSTRLNSSHGYISYAVFCLKKKKKKNRI